MTKKDFQRFADMFREQHQQLFDMWEIGKISQISFVDRQRELEAIKDKTIQIFMESNKNFSPSKFRQACDIASSHLEKRDKLL
jgi:hypothetical protein